MRLTSITLSNFRSFYGTRQLNFSDDEEKRVTIFYGENGSGKTNLLNAIYWCVRGTFTPRFQKPEALVNKEAFKNGTRQCYVEIEFRDDEDDDKYYRVRRTATNVDQISFDVFSVKKGNSTVVPKGDSLIRKLLPEALISWFFFDAEAIGSLDLDGSEEFKQDLRKTLGFDLVDKLLEDLNTIKNKRAREVAQQVNDKELKNVAAEIEDMDRVLPQQHASAIEIEKQVKKLKSDIHEIRNELAKQPQAEPIERNRRSIESQIRRLDDDKKKLLLEISELVGSASAPLAVLDLARGLEGVLEQQEVKGRLPSPYSDQLVKDILGEKLCICGRPVTEGSAEASKINDLMKFASTSSLNHRISQIRYLIRDIEKTAAQFPIDVQSRRAKVASIELQLGQLESEYKELSEDLKKINKDVIRELEQKREDLDVRLQGLLLQAGGVMQQIELNERRKKDLQARYDNLAKKITGGNKLKIELLKTEKLMEYIRAVSQKQEQQALKLLSIELNSVLDKYLTKHFKARIDPNTYAVYLLDQEGRRVGHSTGEEQVLKFAFIAAVVAMAAMKTQQKIQWLSHPTIAPLVLDAPFSALDPEYQGSVARNLASQTTQLILMISSAAWVPSVEQALEPHVGKRYLIISKESGPQAGPQGLKPVKSIRIKGTQYALNEYDAPYAESVFKEIPV